MFLSTWGGAVCKQTVVCVVGGVYVGKDWVS